MAALRTSTRPLNSFARPHLSPSDNLSPMSSNLFPLTSHLAKSTPATRESEQAPSHLPPVPRSKDGSPGDGEPSRRNSNASYLTTPIAHPYARLYAKRDVTKRRKIWNHALEKSLFTSHELATMGAPHRRTIYSASLDAHVDRLHSQLLSLGYFPIPLEKLEPFRGLNCKTAKGIVAALQHDASLFNLKLLELERANQTLRESLVDHRPTLADLRRLSEIGDTSSRGWQ